MKLPPVLLIEWYDAEHPGGEWASVKSLTKTKLPTIRSCGFLMHEDKSLIVLALSYDGENVSGEMTIPKRMIRRRRKLKE